jgi:hypothetical protein
MTQLVIPSLYIGLGGWPKSIFPRLDAHFYGHYGSCPDCLPRVIFDFDDASGEVTVGGKTFSTHPYLKALPKKPLVDFARKLRRKDKEAIAFLERFSPYVALEHLRAIETPGLNLHVQNGNFAWRLVWETHVLPELITKLQHLHVPPHDQAQLARQGLAVSNRSVIWVIAGGGSTTGPTGLIPVLCELKRRKPPQTSLFALVLTPRAYRDKDHRHQIKGRAIFRATLQQLLAIYGGQVFDQPYGLDGYRITLSEEPFDQLFLVDGSLSGGRTDLKATELADLLALLLFKLAVGPVGEKLLGTTMGNLNSEPQEESHEEH